MRYARSSIIQYRLVLEESIRRVRLFITQQIKRIGAIFSEPLSE